jgi:hypothetical protein
MPEFMYMPYQRLDNYEYKESTSILSIVESLNAYLRYGEYLECQEKDPVIPAGSYSIELHFDVKGKGVENTSYLCEPQPVLIAIEPLMPYSKPVPVTDSAKKSDVKGKLTERLKTSINPLLYTTFSVRAIINPPVGYTSVPVTNTISKDDTVVIVA